VQPPSATQPSPDPRYDWPPTPDAPVARRRKHSRAKAGWLAAAEWGILIVSAVAIALLIKTFLFQAFYIPSASMEPTLKIHDRVLVNKLSYKLHDVHRGDIVVFKRPPGEDRSIKDLVKRVIGLPHETISGRDGFVYIDGTRLREPYLPKGTRTDFEGLTRFKIPPDSYWVMGDNRTNSRDSRFFKGHVIHDKDIVGRVFLRIWPLNRLDIL
jgi:signal peptidase I